jgi:diacylglycerol diphosphate phosphatase/phosphatidate phosphatase
MAVDRISLGLDRFSVYPLFKKWRIGDLILVPIVFIINGFVYFVNPPFERQFVINDLSINHPFAEHERVPNELNMIYSLAIPCLVIVIVTFLLGDPKHRFYVGYISILGLFVSFFVNELFTDVLKNWVGRHRPDFIARCIPRPDAPKDVLVFAKDVCTSKNLRLLADGFRTTPSGHSSSAFAGLGYLSLWLMGQLLTEHPLTGSWRMMVASIPALGAALIALSRTEDYRHHFIDVVLGSLLGGTVAYWAYRRNFPELTSTSSFKPYLDDSDVASVEHAIRHADAGEDCNSHLLNSQV